MRIWLFCLLSGLPSFLVCAAAARGSEEDPADCPEWVKEKTPAWVQPFLGPHGLDEPYRSMEVPLAMTVKGIDRWQANHFVVHRAETRRYLYGDYTPLKISYKAGTFPAIERLAQTYTKDAKGDREKALALLKAMGAQMRHPSVPPLGPLCPTDRNMEDESLLKTATGWCNEQARIYVRLCQVSGIPARMIFLFYSDRKSGHVIAEFYADGRWSMVDTSWLCAFPAADGHLMSAAECHEAAAGQQVAKAYLKRMQEVAEMGDEELAGRAVKPESDPAKREQAVQKLAERQREDIRKKTRGELARWLWEFGVMNYPLPGEGKLQVKP